MNFVQVSEIRIQAVAVVVTDDTLSVELEDGRTISVPLVWYPRLAYGSPEERQNFEISSGGYGIHWPDLDEDISVEGMLIGRKSGESPESFSKWRSKRTEGFGPVQSFTI